MKKILLVLCCVLTAVCSIAQAVGTNSLSKKSIQATRTAKPPKIDGFINDTVWQKAAVAKDFIMNSPDFGKPASLPAEVRLLYDDEAIYVAAFLKDDPKLIRRQLTARDGEQRQDVDFFGVFFDTYNDDQNGFQFTVTSRNVQTDGRVSPAVSGGWGPPSDYSWDAVWESNVQIVENGWTVEMKIPYISLRFAKVEIQNWGINFQRFSRRLNESSYWNPIDPNQAGFVNQFGDLTGLTNLVPPLRLSFLPYVTAGARSVPKADGTVQRDVLRNGGMDIKWGVNESFTYDGTLIPDFGQVISDNVILNLSPFEVMFQENRPFFTEGTELFNKAGLFYSRRIGLTPSGYFSVRRRAEQDPNLRIVKNPGVTQLINASKYSGRNRKNLGIGVFNAVSAPTFALLENTSDGKTERIETEPLTNYNIVVLDQALKNRSSITFTNTNVLRAGTARDANVSSFDFSLFDAKNNFNLAGFARYSKIFSVNPYDGFSTNLAFRKVSGKFQFNFSHLIESDRYDPNDLGFLRAPNESTIRGQISYNQFTPTKNFLSYNYRVGFRNQSLYKPGVWQELMLDARAFYFFKNFWDLSIVYDSKPVWQHDWFELRTPGRMIRMMPWHYFGFNGSTDSRKRLYVEARAGYAYSPAFDTSHFFNYGLGVRFRFSDRFSLSINGSGSTDIGNVGYAFRRETNGEPIVGWRDVKEFTTLVQALYNFTPRMFITLRARHYWSHVKYHRFFNVDAKGNWVDRSFIAGNDENYNAYNLDMFYTWDFMYGSRLIIGWKNWMPQDMFFSGEGFDKYSRNLREVFSRPQGKELTVRLIYFLDYQKLKRKRVS